ESGTDVVAFAVDRPVTCINAGMTVHYVMSGDASNGLDYSNLTETVRLEAGETNALITVSPIVDEIWTETEESVVITLTANDYYLGSPTQQTALILDNVATVMIYAVTATTIWESGTDVVEFTVDRSAACTNAGITVNYSVTGTASNGADYSELTNSVRMEAGETNATITVDPIVDDVWTESEEDVVITLTTGDYYLGSSTQQTASILDNVATVSLHIVDATAAETGPDVAKLSVGRPVACTSTWMTVYYVMSGTASNGSDYNLLSGEVVIGTGATNALITITPIDDDVWAESEEDVVIGLTEEDYILDPPTQQTVWIRDNELAYYWTKRLGITFSGYDGGETLVDFPALVILSTNLSGFDYNAFGSPGGWNDLRFTDSADDSALSYEIEKWDTGGKSYVWVRIPALTKSTIIWAYWGNTNQYACGSPPDYAVD
ncbi:unnamed protein product, partial [marine sediment metagenome]